MSDSTPSSLFKRSLTLTTAIAVVMVSGTAEAYNRRNQLPSIEVRLEVLESLRQQAEMEARQRAVPPQPSAGQPASQDMPFGRPSAPLTQPQVRTQGGAQYQPSTTVPAVPRPASPAPAQPALQPQTTPSAPAAVDGYATYQPSEVTPAPAPVPTPKPAEKPAPKAEPKKAEPKKPEPKKTEPKKPAPEPKKQPEAKKPEPKPAVSEPAIVPPPLPREEEPLTGLPELPAMTDMPEFPEMEELEVMPPLDIPDMPSPRKLDDMPELEALPPLTEKADEPLRPERVEPDLPVFPEPDLLEELPPPPLLDGDDGLGADTDDVLSPLEPLPMLEEVPDAEAEVSTGGVVTPLVVAPAPKEEKGLFSGLVSQVKSMLGMEEKAPARAPLVADDDDGLPVLPLPEGAAPMQEDGQFPAMPDLIPDAVEEETESEAVVPPPPGLPTLPRSGDRVVADAEDELSFLPPLPRENVDEVPVATTPNRSLPSLGAIMTEERREQMAPPPLPELDELSPLPQTPADVETSVAANTADLMSLDDMPALPAPDTGKDKEMELAALPSPPLPDSLKAADVPSAGVKAPEVTNKGKPNQRVRLFYGREDTEVSTAMQSALSDIAAAMKADASLRLSMNSYAGSDPDQDVPAKRISLKRALAIRTYLIESGVDADRIAPPRALGNDVPEGPVERVDIFFEKG